MGGLMTLLAAGACNFDVENPGPVQDEALYDAGAHQAVVTGAVRTYAIALGEGIAMQTGAVAREIMASGNTNISIDHGLGKITPQSGLWADIQETRWIAEDGVRRLTEAAAKDSIKSQAHLWAGYANRWGELLCDAVIDGGPKQPYTVMLDKAIAHFTQAIALSPGTNNFQTNLRPAALAGRASVYATLNRWNEAVADARQVPEAYVFQARYSSEEAAQRNQIYFYSANVPYRVHSVWGTPYEQYYIDTADPRTPWIKVPEWPFGEIQRPKIGNVTWWPQRKYKAYTDPINIASGREMRLIEAEALLVGNNITGAMALINQVRTTSRPGSGVRPATVTAYTATTLADAWTALRRERGIEMWIEGRRLADLRRWKAANRPGVGWALEDPTNPKTYLDQQDLCVPVSQA
jgi:hypothetical protein